MRGRFFRSAPHVDHNFRGCVGHRMRKCRDHVGIVPWGVDSLSVQQIVTPSGGTCKHHFLLSTEGTIFEAALIASEFPRKLVRIVHPKGKKPTRRHHPSFAQDVRRKTLCRGVDL